MSPSMIPDGQASPTRASTRGVASGLEHLGPYYLLGLPSVQAELGLSRAQQDGIIGINQRRSRDLDALARDRQQFDALKKSVRDRADGAMLATLTAEQRTRFAQIALQAKGLFEALTEPGFQQQVALREPQKARWSQALGAARSRERKLMRERSAFLMQHRVAPDGADAASKVAAKQYRPWDAVGLSRADYLEFQKYDHRIETLRRETAEQFVQALDASQQATVQGLLGRPFDFGLPAEGTEVR